MYVLNLFLTLPLVNIVVYLEIFCYLNDSQVSILIDRY